MATRATVGVRSVPYDPANEHRIATALSSAVRSYLERSGHGTWLDEVKCTWHRKPEYLEVAFRLNNAGAARHRGLLVSFDIKDHAELTKGEDGWASLTIGDWGDYREILATCAHAIAVSDHCYFKDAWDESWSRHDFSDPSPALSPALSPVGEPSGESLPGPA